MAKARRTSGAAARAASRVLRSKSAGKDSKRAAAWTSRKLRPNGSTDGRTDIVDGCILADMGRGEVKSHVAPRRRQLPSRAD